MDDEAPVARYDPAAGTLRLRLTGGEEVVVGGLGPDLPIWRTAGTAPTGALWLTAEQADVLAKMIEYILGRVKVSAPSQRILEQVGPQVVQLRDELIAASTQDDEYYDEDGASP